MYSSSEDSDSDSGTNFKRGKRKIKADSPPVREARLDTKRSTEKVPSRLRKDDDVREGRHEVHRDASSSVTHKTNNGEKKARKSPERLRDIDVARLRSRSCERGERQDINKTHHSKSSERPRDDIDKKKNSRSSEKISRDHTKLREKSPSQRKEYAKDPKKELRHNEDIKKAKDAPRTREHHVEQSKPHHHHHHHHRSKSPPKHSKDDRRHISHKDTKEFSSHDRQVTRTDDKSRHSNDSKKSRKSSICDDTAYGPALPPQASSLKNDVDDCMPTMPRHLQRSPMNQRPKIGPTMPKDFRAAIETNYSRVENYDVISSDDDDNMIGPLPASAEMSERDLELEKRKIEIKLQQLDRRAQAVTSQDMRHREEWMLELPEVKHVADMGLTSRQFRKNNRPDFSDRSSWTKTPNDQHKPKTHEKHKSDDDKRRELEVRRRDEEQERQAKEHKKIHKRDKTLLEIHEKKLKKEKVILMRNLIEKDLNSHKFVCLQKKQKDEKKERRPFNRDSDLSANKFDAARKKAVCKKAQLLDSRFSSGNKKYL